MWLSDRVPLDLILSTTKEDFIQDNCSRYRDHFNGVLQQERDWAQPKIQHGQVAIYSQGAERSQWMENDLKIRDKTGILAKPS